MVTMRGVEQNTADAGYGVPRLGKALALQSSLWEELKEKFLKGQPKVLGAMQITAGLLIFSVGMVMMSITLSSYREHSLTVYSGYSVWGSLMFVISGFFSIATARRTTKGLVRASLGLNISSSVFAGVGMILTMASLALNSSFPFSCGYYAASESCSMIRSLLLGMDAVLLLLSMLELCLAISVSSFGCKVTCCYLSGVMLILPSTPHMTETRSPAPPGGRLMDPAHPEESLPGSVP